MAKRKVKRPKPPSHIQYDKVPNPFFAPEHPISSTNPTEVVAAKNTRESAIETLFARKLLDKAQKEAADRFLAIHMRAGGTIASLDYSLDRVDNGSKDPIAARLIAAEELTKLAKEIGNIGIRLLEDVICKGHSLDELAATKRQKLTLADNLRTYLDKAAFQFGFANKKVAA